MACYSTLPNYAKSCGSFRNLKYCLNKKLAQSCPIFKDVSNFHSSVKKNGENEMFRNLIQYYLSLYQDNIIAGKKISKYKITRKC